MRSLGETAGSTNHPHCGYSMPMSNQCWLVKQEPSVYSWETFVQEEGAEWSGIRNFQARNFLRAMKRGDLVLFYHSGETREVVGLARVSEEAYPDPTAEEGDWSAVELEPVKTLKSPVSLEQIKADPELQTMSFLRQSRLSVAPVTPDQLDRILQLAGMPTQHGKSVKKAIG